MLAQRNARSLSYSADMHRDRSPRVCGVVPRVVDRRSPESKPPCRMRSESIAACSSATLLVIPKTLSQFRHVLVGRAGNTGAWCHRLIEQAKKGLFAKFLLGGRQSACSKAAAEIAVRVLWNLGTGSKGSPGELM